MGESGELRMILAGAAPLESRPMSTTLTVAVAQVAPVIMNRAATIEKIVARIDEAAGQGAALVAFGEALVPGYPSWIERSDGARFNSQRQKEIHACYVRAAVDLDAGDLADVQAAAQRGSIHVVLGVIERAPDRGGHSLYCTCVSIGPDGAIRSAHRKVMPTYEERLTWSVGDGAGLVVHPLGPFTLGALNCYENWLPLARASLHAQGEDLHVAIWPGGVHNTQDLTRFAAFEGRSYVLSASGLIRAADYPADFPHRDAVIADESETMANGGSCIAGPDGQWIVEPVVDREALIVAEIDHERVLQERQNLDISGHYSRPDIFRLSVDRRRQGLVDFEQ